MKQNKQLYKKKKKKRREEKRFFLRTNRGIRKKKDPQFKLQKKEAIKAKSKIHTTKKEENFPDSETEILNCLTRRGRNFNLNFYHH